MGQRGNWERFYELVDGDYRDLPEPDDFKTEPERDWPEDMTWEGFDAAVED